MDLKYINLVKLANLCPLMNNSNMLSQVGILLSTGRAGAAKLVVDIHNVPLQVSLQVTGVATVATLEVFQLKLKIGKEKNCLPNLHYKFTWICCWLTWCLRFVNSLKQWGHLSFFSSFISLKRFL